ncbi:protein of unknown function [Nitrosomonas marina]|uniref:DUF4062 domain-containing protein n=1 Tax=Nitrosomonas marina TaxID=917 RepID=A0A1I0FUV0_9PROT|nr:DUF4062 domain-containing protein [Nitrosomonas marina]SET62005.1 protein of unknown function [Nitrosomonas marina]
MKEKKMHTPVNYKGIMVSSTFSDLKEHRKILMRAIDRQGFKSVAMENDSAKPDVDMLESSLQMVQNSFAYICLISRKYGQIPEDSKRNPDRLSITELEFDEANRLNRPILVFYMGRKHLLTIDDIETDPEKIEKLNTFRKKSEQYSETSKIKRVYSVFETLEEFKEYSIQAIANLRKFIDDPETNCKESSHFSKNVLLKKYAFKERFIGLIISKNSYLKDLALSLFEKSLISQYLSASVRIHRMQA